MSVALSFDRVSRAIPRYERRDGQLAMAEAVARALAERRHLLVEAPCGVGKTFAYLVPAILHARERRSKVIVCTANIALQEQLLNKDLPVLSKALGIPVTTALVKGLNNYLCLERYEGNAGQLYLLPAERALWQRLDAWRHATTTGDQTELELPPDDPTWLQVNGVNELCNGSDCRFYQECFAMEARRRAHAVEVIVTNYHLYFAHVAVREAAERDVILPGHDALICDEAQEMADIARDFFGSRFSPHGANLFLQGAGRIGLGRDAEKVRRAVKSFFRQVTEYRDSPRYRVRLREPGYADARPLADALAAFREGLTREFRAAQSDEEKDRIAKLVGAADQYALALADAVELREKNKVYWIDPEGRLVSRLIDPSEPLRERVFRRLDTVVLTSATLATGQSFDFVKRETGAERAEELVVPTPFDFRTQALLLIPPMSRDPRDAGFVDEVGGYINRFIRHLGGRTLCLFTSYRNLEACAALAQGTGVRILVQGTAPRTKLLEEFRQDRGTALFGTSSFWQGVDVPGEALSCLVIDKLPFLTPEDPLLNALQERADDTFETYSVPKAALMLRQGFGRLIRSRTDRGVVVICDRRLMTTRYGREMLSCLPDVPVTRDPAAFEGFFGNRPEAGVQ